MLFTVVLPMKGCAGGFVVCRAGAQPVDETTKLLALPGPFPPVPTRKDADDQAGIVTVCVKPQPLFWKAISTFAVVYRAGSVSFDEPPGAVIVTVTLVLELFVNVSGTRPATPAPTFAIADGFV